MAEERCSARRITRSHSWGRSIPAASAAIGNKLVSVIPGETFHVHEPRAAVGVDHHIGTTIVSQTERFERA